MKALEKNWMRAIETHYRVLWALPPCFTDRLAMPLGDPCLRRCEGGTAVCIRLWPAQAEPTGREKTPWFYYEIRVAIRGNDNQVANGGNGVGLAVGCPQNRTLRPALAAKVRQWLDGAPLGEIGFSLVESKRAPAKAVGLRVERRYGLPEHAAFPVELAARDLASLIEASLPALERCKSGKPATPGSSRRCRVIRGAGRP